MTEGKGSEDTQSEASPEQNVKAASYINSIISLTEVDVGVYRGETPFIGMNLVCVYGGQLVAQAMAAASKRVPDDFSINSLHSYFVRRGCNKLPIIYYVENARDGRNFCIRHVRASQKGKVIFFLIASFQRKRMGGLVHQVQMPDAPEPNSILSDYEYLTDLSKDIRLPDKVRRTLATLGHLPFPVDIKRVDPVHLFFPEKREPSQMLWMKAKGKLSDSKIVHQCVAAYGSDSATVATMLRPHGIGTSHPRLRVVSLDHSMWFHSDFRADEWLLYCLESPRTSSSRGLVIGHIFDRSGKLCVSVTQEGYLDYHDKPSSPPSKL